MPKSLDLTKAPPFGRLRVLRRSGSDRHGQVWECLCDPKLGGCGAIVHLGTNRLTTGNTRSCGCLHKNVARRNAQVARAAREHACLQCGKPCREKYCSRDCGFAYRRARRPPVPCRICGKPIYPRKTGNVRAYCSERCQWTHDNEAAARKRVATDAASLAAELERRLNRGQTSDDDSNNTGN